MISLIMPYWHRLPELNASLAAYDKLYRDLDLEIIIADDGCGLTKDQLVPTDLDIKIINLPKKDVPKCPVVPLNMAAKKARGEFLAITNPEALHETPVLNELRDAVIQGGYKHCCSPSVWSEKHSTWYTHTTCDNGKLGRVHMPPNAPLHFLLMMHTEFFMDVGGYDEEYRDGSSYDDTDFVWRLADNGATFQILDDLKIIQTLHPPIKWPPGSDDRNKKLFYRKWGHKI